MPAVQIRIVSEIPKQYQGRSWPVPTSDTLRPTCDAADFPALAAEGVAGPIRIMSISNAGTRQHADGTPMLWRVEFACVSQDGRLPEVSR